MINKLQKDLQSKTTMAMKKAGKGLFTHGEF